MISLAHGITTSVLFCTTVHGGFQTPIATFYVEETCVFLGLQA